MSKRKAEQEALTTHVKRVETILENVQTSKGGTEKLARLLKMEGFVDELLAWTEASHLAANKGVFLVKKAIWDKGLGRELMKAVRASGKFEPSIAERLFTVLQFVLQTKKSTAEILNENVVVDLLQLASKEHENKELGKLAVAALQMAAQQSADLCYEMCSHPELMVQVQRRMEAEDKQLVRWLGLVQTVAQVGGQECLEPLMEANTGEHGDQLLVGMLQLLSAEESLSLVQEVLATLRSLVNNSTQAVASMKHLDTHGMLMRLDQDMQDLIAAGVQVADARRVQNGIEAVLQDSGIKLQVYDEESAALKLQSVYRSHRVRQELAKEEEKRHAAARTIQRRTRGLLARRAMDERRQDDALDQERRKHERAIAKQEHRLRELETMPSSQVSAWKGMQTHLTVMRVQAHWRGLVQRRKYREMRAQERERKRHEKAKAIQRTFREHRKRTQLRMAMQQLSQPKMMARATVRAHQDRILVQRNLRNHHTEDDYYASLAQLKRKVAANESARIQQLIGAQRRKNAMEELDKDVEALHTVTSLENLSLADLDTIVSGMPSVHAVDDESRLDFENRLEFVRMSHARHRYADV